MNDSHPTPNPQLVGARPGAVEFGWFASPIGPIRASDHQLRSALGGFVNEDERDRSFRSFHFVGAVAPGVATGCAITNTSSGPTAFAYLWADGKFTELRLSGRGTSGAQFAADPDAGSTRLSGRRGTVEITADGAGHKRLQVEAEALTIDVAFNDSDADVMRLCTPTGPTGWAYVQKVVAIPVVGAASAGSTVVDLSDALAHQDYTTGFLRDETWWHWACIAGQLSTGERFGLNLSCGTNESGYRENGGWIGDKWFPLGGALFDFDPDDIEAPWRVTGTDVDFELTFRADHGYHAHHDSDTVATNFHQLFGSFDGWVDVPSSGRTQVTGLSGFAESQFLRW